MILIKKTEEYKVFKRGDERYAVQDATGKPINGEEKVKILLAEELIKATLPAEPVAEVEEEATAEEEPVAEGEGATEEGEPSEADDAEEPAEG
ncbi:MAG: hypothetical protein PVJ95_03890 [Cellvibrionales bacterium]